MEADIHLTVDGQQRPLAVDTRTTLLDALRDRLGVTAPKKGCDHGQAFLDHDGFQCGYCTPGQVCSAVGMLDEVKAGHASSVTDDLTAPIELDDEEIRERMSGNLCRCGAYVNIVTAIRESVATSAQTSTTPTHDQPAPHEPVSPA